MKSERMVLVLQGLWEWQSIPLVWKQRAASVPAHGESFPAPVTFQPVFEGLQAL